MDPTSRLSLHTGNEMPVLGLGTWQLTKDTEGTVAYALERGYRMIDTASDYGTQAGIGAALARSGIDRHRLYIVTKVEETDDPYRAARANLAEMKLDYADLMLIHRPPVTGIGRTLWEGLIRVKEEALAKDIGVSNYRIEQIESLARKTGEMPAVNQIEWSPFGRSDEMDAFCRRHGIVIQAYSPLTRAKRLGDSRLAKIARRYRKTPAQLLIRWNLELGTVPLPKANRREHVRENLDVFGFKIDEHDMAELNAMNERYSSLGGLPYG